VRVFGEKLARAHAAFGARFQHVHGDENETEEAELPSRSAGPRESGESAREGVRGRGETGGIAFMLVVSFGLGNFGRWLVRGAQSGLPDLT